MTSFEADLRRGGDGREEVSVDSEGEIEASEEQGDVGLVELTFELRIVLVLGKESIECRRTRSARRGREEIKPQEFTSSLQASTVDILSVLRKK